MSYRIQYGPKLPQEKRSRRPTIRLPALILVLVIVVLSMKLAFPEKSQQLKQALFPWTQPDTQAAFHVLIEEVKKGEDLSDAISAFCMQILQYAENAS